MKHLKLFEKLLGEPKEGDYVISKYDYPNDRRWQAYINKSIGQVINVKFSKWWEENMFDIKYYVTDEIFDELFVGTDDEEDIKYENDKKYIIMKGKYMDFILDFSPNEKILKRKLQSRKYGLKENVNINPDNDVKKGDYVFFINGFDSNFVKKDKPYIVDSIEPKISGIYDLAMIKCEDGETRSFRAKNSEMYRRATEFELKKIKYNLWK